MSSLKSNSFHRQIPTLQHLGGKDTVTGSCHLLRTDDTIIMVDCGLPQGDDTISPMNEWEVLPKEIDYLFLTHAHIDHIGRLPQLVWAGFNGEIICSHATKALLVPLLEDALSFTDYSAPQKRKMIKVIKKLSRGVDYGRRLDLKDDINCTLFRAGHILGSSFLFFQFPLPQGENWSVVFSGDLGNKGTVLLNDPDPPPTCDLLIMESTYGDRLHEDRTRRLETLGKILVQALSDKGKVFIPAFALGRTQELLYDLDRLFSDDKWGNRFPELQQDGKGKAPVPVFVDSPLALKITDIYNDLKPFWDAEAKALLTAGDHPFDFVNLYRVDHYREHKQILEFPGSVIIIAGSGMCSGGRIVDHLIAGLSEQKNDVLFVGYQAKGTPGRTILNYADSKGYVRLNGRKITIMATVHQLTGYSAHADQQGLLDWVSSMPGKPGAIRLVHGEETAQMVLADVLVERGYHVIS